MSGHRQVVDGKLDAILFVMRSKYAWQRRRGRCFAKYSRKSIHKYLTCWSYADICQASSIQKAPDSQFLRRKSLPMYESYGKDEFRRSPTGFGREANSILSLVDDMASLIALSYLRGNVHYTQTVASTLQKARTPVRGCLFVEIWTMNRIVKDIS